MKKQIEIKAIQVRKAMNFNTLCAVISLFASCIAVAPSFALQQAAHHDVIIELQEPLLQAEEKELSEQQMIELEQVALEQNNKAQQCIACICAAGQNIKNFVRNNPRTIGYGVKSLIWSIPIASILEIILARTMYGTNIDAEPVIAIMPAVAAFITFNMRKELYQKVMRAIMGGDLATVRYIYKTALIDINRKPKAWCSDPSWTWGYTILIYAVKESQPEIVKFLLDNGADIYLKDYKGLTAHDYLEINPNDTDEEQQNKRKIRFHLAKHELVKHMHVIATKRAHEYQVNKAALATLQQIFERYLKKTGRGATAGSMPVDISDVIAPFLRV